MADFDASPTQTQPKRKPFLFKRRPVKEDKVEDLDPFADQSTTKEGGSKDDDLDLFKQAKTFFPKAVKEQKQRAERESRSKEEEPTVLPSQQAGDARPSKRRRLSAESDIYGVSDDESNQRSGSVDATDHPVSSPPTTGATVSASPAVTKPTPVDKGKAPAVPYSLYSSPPRQQTRSAATRPVASSEGVIELLDSDDDVPPTPSTRTRSRAVPSRPSPTDVVDLNEAPSPTAKPAEVESEVVGIEDGYDDPDLRRYIQEAKQRAQQAAKDKESRVVSSEADRSFSAASPPRHDPVINIFITARLPGQPIPPVMAKMRFSQPMGKLRDYFIVHARKHGMSLSEEEVATIFLTWKGNKIYPTTTGHSLKLTPNSSGRFLSTSGATILDSEGFKKGGLDFEAWTASLYRNFQLEKERLRNRTLEGNLDDSDIDDDLNVDEGDAQSGAAEGAGANVRLTLKPKDMEPVRLTAHPDTIVATMMEVFRTQRGIEENKQVALFFDGERLDPEATVADLDIEDMDSIEVHVS